MTFSPITNGERSGYTVHLPEALTIAADMQDARKADTLCKAAPPPAPLRSSALLKVVMIAGMIQEAPLLLANPSEDPMPDQKLAY